VFRQAFSARNYLYALEVPELQQRVLDNLVSDVLLGSVLLLVSAYGLHRLAKVWKISVVPLLVLVPSFLGAGLILYVPFSPLYVRSDGEFYQSWGYSMAAAWLSGEPMDSPQALWPGKGLWPLIIGGFTAIAGPVTITLIVFNALLLVLSAVLLQKATLLLGGRSPGWSMVIVFLSSSPFLLWGPSLLREALFWVGVALGVLALSYASVHRLRFAFLAVGLSTLVLLGIRPDAGIVLVYGFVAMLIFLVGIVGRKRSPLRAVATSVVLLSLALSFPTAFDSVREGVTGQSILDANKALAGENVTTAFGSSSSSSSSSSEEFDYCDAKFSELSLGAAVLCRGTVNLPHAFFGPFYWEYGPEAIWLIVGASTLHFLVLGGLATYYLAISRGRRWPLLALLAVAAASMLMFSSILTNYGILIRFRAVTEILLIPLALSGALELVARWRFSRGKLESSETPKNV